jgi:hypothetical protein
MATNDANGDTNLNDGSGAPPSDSGSPPPAGNEAPDIDKLVQAALDEKLQELKAKLDKAYGLRDAALERVAAFEREKRDGELKRLQEEGKHKEAYEMQLQEERALRAQLEQRNTELTRDVGVRAALSSHPFRNSNALEMAYREVVGQLVRNEQGVWVHKTGESIDAFVKSFVESDANSFLLKAKQSSGSGNPGSGGKPPPSPKTSLFTMSQAEVLKLAREGKLRKP